MKPVFIFFLASKPADSDGKKDYTQVKTSKDLSDQFRVRALANILREFNCIWVDVAIAEKGVLDQYGVHSAPTCIALDLDGSVASMTSGLFAWNDVELDLLAVLESAEARVRELAAGPPEDKKTGFAKARVAAIEIRETYEKGEKLFQRAQWDKAVETFGKLLNSGSKDDFFVKRAPEMIAETAAAKLYFEALDDLKEEKIADGKAKLERIAYEMKNAPCFSNFALTSLKRL